MNENNEHFEQNLISVELSKVSYYYKLSFKNILSGRSITSKAALNECSIEVPHGQMYALLGPSGCGKTTLIRCILRRIRPESGVIKVFGDETKTNYKVIGSVSQELGLLEEFSIEDSLFYFGQLHQMPKDTIKERINFLRNLLNLPEGKRLVSQLSGGQQRLVSLSCALIHSPQLLILDEPTVGVDSLLRSQIWNYLKTLCRDCSVTVIITTHYIEEARSAYMVALIRNGRILEQDSPKHLIQRYECNTLEETFLKICLLDDTPNKVIENSNKASNSIKFYTYNEKKEPESNKILSNLMIILILAKKNWFIMRRNTLILAFYLLFPLFTFSAFFNVYGTNLRLRVALNNNERPPVVSKVLIQSFDNYIQIPFDNVSEAIESVKAGSSMAVISIPSNYSESLKDRIDKGLEVDNDTIIGSTITVYLDMSDVVNDYVFFKELYTSMEKFFQHHLSSLQLNPNAVSLPVQFHEVIYGNLRFLEADLVKFLLPGFILLYVLLTNTCAPAFQFLKDKKGALYERSLACGANPIQFFVSNFLFNCIFSFFQVLWLFVIVFVIWKEDVEGNLWLIFFFVYVQGINGTINGLLFSTFSDDMITVAMLMSGYGMVTILSSGTFWPIESMPYPIKILCSLCPATLPIQSLRSILYRGWGISHFPVLMGFAVSILYIIISFVITPFLLIIDV